MVLLYSEKKQKKAPHFLRAKVTDLDYQGLGIAKIAGKTWFIENALPNEEVEFSVSEEKRQYGRGISRKILRSSPQRQLPKCALYGKCGGCQSQHIPLEQQRHMKQQALMRNLNHLHQHIQWQPMLTGAPWSYRRRVRLSIQYNNKTQQLVIGFRQARSQHIINVEHCPVAETAINQILPKLTTLLHEWRQPQKLGHIELVAADNGIALLLRHIGELNELDKHHLLQFAQQHAIILFVQTADEIQHWYGEQPFYQLAQQKLFFDVRDFIQVNRGLNQAMVDTALNWLDLQKTDHVLDLFCGMGNFTLPLSLKVKSAVGIEGVLPMVEKARNNAQYNQCANVQFFQANLDQSFAEQSWAQQKFNKILLDPPRTGAAFALDAVIQLRAEKILYVSCNPATLVRDSEILLKAGYQLTQAAMIDMFPQTGHLESISLFEYK